jgi:gas vesicle protein
MKKKFIKSRILFVWLFKSPETKKDVHAQLEETIAERKKILPQWEKLFLEENLETKKDIHAQLKETISEFKNAMRQHEGFFTSGQNKNAA